MYRLSHGLAAGLLLLALAAHPAGAQSTAASISGTVVDQQGAVLPGAVVTVKSLDTGQVRAATADASGQYRLLGLVPGSYQLTIELPGFTTARWPDVYLSISQEARLDATLEIAKVAEIVTVVAGDLPLIEPSKTALGRTITTREIEELPIPGRDFGNFAALATLTPGILTDANIYQTGITAAGQAGQSNTFLIDGLSIDDALNAALRGSVSLDAVKEFIVFSNNFSAEYGQASGAVVNVLTRAGTNRYAGRGFYFHQNDRWNATPPTARLATPPQEKPELDQQIAGGFFGGPIARDRAFFFVSAEQVLQDTSYINTSKVLRTFKPDDPITLPVHRQNPKVLGRADLSLGSQSVLTVRYRLHRDSGINALREPRSAEERGMDAFDRVQDAAVLHSQVFGPAAFNEARFQFGRRLLEFNVDPDRYCLGCAALNYSGIRLGKRTNAPQLRTEHRWQFVDAFTYLLPDRFGAHALKAGIDASFIRETSFFPFDFDGTFTFTHSLPFDPANPATYPSKFTRNEGDPHVHLRDNLVSVFAQDQWRPRANLTLNLGVRWDYEDVVGLTDKSNVAPRIGIAVDPWKDGKTSIRAGYGRYYDQIILAIARDAKNAFVQRLVQNPGFPDPFGPNPNRRGGPPPPSTTRFAEETKTPSTEQASIGVQRELPGQVSLAADVVWARGRGLLISRDLNYPDLTDPDRRRPDPNFQQITVVETRGHSWYRGLQVGLQKRHSRHHSYAVAYTLSRSERDTTEDFRSFPQDQRDYGAERGPATSDSRHRLSTTVNLDLPFRLRLTTLVTARSALPYNVTTGSDDNRDAIINDRPPGVGRNSERGSAFWQADARLSKGLRAGRSRIQLLVEAFNVFNRPNWIAYDGLRRSQTFGSPIDAGIPRLLQVGIRMDF
jgi:hypothetical protein